MEKDKKVLGERQKRLRRRKRHVRIVAFVLVAAVPVVLWAAAIGFADELVVTTPDVGVHLPTPGPVMSAQWVMALGVRLAGAEVELDGRDISDDVALGQAGFKYDPIEGLPDGRHLLKAKLDYRVLFVPRVVRKEWLFVTDTVAPQVEFENSVNGVLGTSRRTVNLAGITEGLVRLKARYQGRTVASTKVDGTGKFDFKIQSAEDEGTLRVTAVDRAGNEGTRQLSVVYDTTPPRVLSTSPGPDTTVRGENTAITVSFDDVTSGIKSASLRLDDQEVPATFSAETNSLSFQPPRLADGSHKVSFEAEDSAGNKGTTEWSFDYDSTYLRIDISERRLYHHRNGQLQATYAVAVGLPQFPTPRGNWRIVNKRKNPVWRNPKSGWSLNMPDMIPAGPNNPLGQRALDLSVPGIRIHGTPNVRSVGTAASHGCLRMIPSQIEILFDQVGAGTPVEIVS